MLNNIFFYFLKSQKKMYFVKLLLMMIDILIYVYLIKFYDMIDM